MLLHAFLLSLPIAPLAQESTRTLDRPGEHHKHLTVDTVDRWLLDGVEDEVLRVDVRSDAFDPVLQLVRLDGAGRVQEVLIPEVDDPGSTSHMLKRLPAAGPLAILVHGPGERGGGNYRLYVERLRSVPLQGREEFLVGRLDEKGYAHVRFTARAGDAIVPRGRGVVEVLDPKGYSLPNWRGCFTAKRDGEHYLRVRDQARAPFRVGLAPVPRRPIVLGQSVEATVAGQGLDEWTLETVAGGMQIVELEGAGLESRFLLHGERPTSTLDDAPTHRWLPTHSKGAIRRTAYVARVAVGQRIQVRSRSERPTPYRITFRDPSASLAIGEATEATLPVGGSAYWTFEAEPGEVLSLDVTSDAFDPMVRLYDSLGAQIVEVDDAGGALASQHSWLVRNRGRVYLEVLSYGNGGGGALSVTLARVDVPRIAVGDRTSITLAEGATAYWHMDVGEQDRLLVLADAEGFVPQLALYDADGVERASAAGSDQDEGVLLNLRRPGAGRYTLALSGRSGGGKVSLRTIDPDE